MTPFKTPALAALALCLALPFTSHAAGPAKPPPAPPSAPNQVPLPAVPPSTAPAAPVLTAQGFGPLRIGMTWAAAHQAMPSLVQGEALDQCYEATSPRYPGLGVMFEEGRLVRVSAWERGAVGTTSGVRVGMAEAEVRRRVPRGLVQAAHEYEDPPAKYLTFWVVRNRSGIRFEIDHSGRVSAIHAGGPAIQYVEGCA